LKSPKIKYHFSIKSEDELKDLSYEELIEYTKNLTKDWHKLKKPKKDSSNSSIAPSSEIVSPTKKKNQSLRDKSNKLTGGQKGHKGKTLKQANNPDEIIDIKYSIETCKKCDYDLKGILAKLKEKRQILDLNLKDINTKITQYQSYSKTCPNCGYENHDNRFDNNIAPYISYGKNIMALVVYLSTVHYLSYNRIVLAIETLYNLNITQGAVDNIIKRASKFSQNEIDKIVSQLKISDKIGIDETGAKVNGTKGWHWVFQNDTCTYIVYNKSRGTKVIAENFEDGFVNAVVVHDNYSSYNNLIAKGEQLCLAHKLRDLNYAIACDNTKLMKDIKILLQEAMLDHKLDLLPQQRVTLKQQYEKSFDYLLTRPIISKSETAKQINSLTKARSKILTFLLYPNVPPDNNGSERAIRNIKVKLKVSQQFKSPQGAKDYATLRSIVDTSRKRGINEFEALRDVIGGDSVF
jgi:transposase-like protein